MRWHKSLSAGFNPNALQFIGMQVVRQAVKVSAESVELFAQSAEPIRKACRSAWMLMLKGNYTAESRQGKPLSDIVMQFA